MEKTSLGANMATQPRTLVDDQAIGQEDSRLGDARGASSCALPPPDVIHPFPASYRVLGETLAEFAAKAASEARP